MVIIPKSGVFLKDGAIVPDKKELSAMIHALKVEYAKVKEAGGHFYGPSWGPNLSLTIEEMRKFIIDLEKYQEERGA
ncbi:MAG: hypothetical protein HYW69_02140 [Candidatus Nealsonbacteria bacterium]|nr:hypothetical protein [Candidatus Nealsonbacteria bacterium]